MKNWILALACLAACGGGEPRAWEGRGVVLDVNSEYQQVLIEHEAIGDFMPAMTMNFDVSGAAVLEGVEKGQAVSFRLERDGKRYTVTAIQVLSEDEARASGLSLDAAPLGPAPDFTLTDQDGAAFSLADVHGKAVVLDFIYTHCPGPCPILTGILRDTQQGLSEELGARTHFVSISVDPERDTPEVLRAYAGHRGIDTRNWSLLTGTPQEVEAVLERFGVATESGEDDNVQHLVLTLLIDPEGRIVERYLGTQHGPEELLRDIERVLS